MNFKTHPETRLQTPLRLMLGYVLAIVAVAVAMGLRLALTAWVGPGLPTYITFYPAVMVVALLYGFWSGLLATAFASVLVVYWLLPPIGQFYIASPVDRVGIVLFSSCGLFMSLVAEFTRRYRSKAAAYDREAALRGSEERLALAVSATQIGMFDWNLTKNSILWSQTQEAIFGYAPATTTITTTTTEQDFSRWTDRIHPEDLPRFEEESRRCIQDYKPLEVRYRIIWPDGSLHWVDTKGVLMYDSDDKANRIVGVVMDITERKNAEEALFAREARYRSYIDLTGEIGWVTNAEGEVVEDVPSFRKFTGQTYEEIKGSGWTSALHPDDVERTLQTWNKAVTTKGTYEIEYRLRRHDGIYRDFLARGFPVFRGDESILEWVGTCIDITERKQIENTHLFLSQYCWARSGEDFFEVLARHLADNLGMDYVCIDRLVGDGLIAQTVAVYFNGKFEDNVTYALKDTPCGDVVGKTICCFPKDVRSLFPQDVVLREIGAESYVGTTLFSSMGQPIGLIAVIGRHPLTTPKQAEAILELVSITAARELERREAEQALRESAERNRIILQTAMDGFLLIDTQGRLLEANEAYCHMTGYSKSELQSMAILDLEAVESPEETLTHIQRIMRHGEDRFESRHRRKDGSVFDVEISVQHQPIEGGQFVVFLRDITERKRAEAALTEAKLTLERERDILQVVMDGAKNSHLVYLDRDFNFVRVNETYAQTCGYRPDQMIGKNHFALYPHEENESIFAIVRDTGKPMAFHDKPFEFPDQPERGVTYWDWTLTPVKNPSGQVDGLVFSLFETTERKRAEETLRENKARLDLALMSARMGVWHWDILENRRYFDPQVCQLLGIAPESFRGTAEEFLAVVHTDDRQKIVIALTQTIEHDVLYESEYRVIWPDRSVHYIAARGQLVRDNNGQPVKINGICWDCTDQKRIEMAIQESKATLQSFFDSAPFMMGLAELEGDRTRAISGNRAISEFLGVAMSDIAGHTGIELGNPEEFERVIVESYRRSQKEGLPMQFEYEYPHASGKRWLSTTVSFVGIWTSGNPWFSFVAEDITERKNAENALRELNEHLEQRVMQRTRFYAIVAGINQAIVKFRNRQELLDEVCKIIIEQGGFRLAWIGMLDAISREVKQQSSCGETAYLDSIRILAADVPEGRGPTGRSIREDCYVVNPDFEEDPNMLPWRERARAHGVRSSCAFPLHSKGTVIGALTIYSAEPSHFTEEEISLLLSISENISFALDAISVDEKRLEAEEALRRFNDELERRVAMRTLDLEAANKELEAFSYSVSHDLRAPLRHISGFIELLGKNLGDQADIKTKSYMTTIATASKKMGVLIDDLLEFSRIGRSAMKMRKVNLNNVIKEAIQDLRADIKDRDIKWKLQGLPDVYGDKSLLRLALINLLSNAIKYTRTRPLAEIEVGYRDSENDFIFFVKDNGVGFDMEYADRLFGVFQRLHLQEEFEGTGIGLANVQRIVERHGGRIWAEGSVGHGASIYFTLPKP